MQSILSTTGKDVDIIDEHDRELLKQEILKAINENPLQTAQAAFKQGFCIIISSTYFIKLLKRRLKEVGVLADAINLVFMFFEIRLLNQHLFVEHIGVRL